MSATNIQGPEPFWRTVRLLWKSARLRARGRAERQRKLLRQRKGSSSNTLGGLATLFSVLFMAVLHGFMGHFTAECVKAGSFVAVEHEGRMIVSDHFMRDIIQHTTDHDLNNLFANEAWTRVNLFGGNRDTQAAAIREHYLQFGRNGFTDQNSAPSSLEELREMPPLAMLCGTVMFVWWFVMLTMQGEGLELDVQRRRHPMWEWLLSHPVRPEAAFLAEMVSPLVANPAYLAAPIYWIVLLTHVWSFGAALAGGILIGTFFAIAAACLNKTLELCAMLKLSIRTRGAALGLMSWLGYALFIIPLFAFGRPGVLAVLAGWLISVAPSFHPNVLAWLLGNWSGNSFSMTFAVLAALIASGVIVGVCAFVGKWGTASGLEGGFDNAPKTPRLLDFSRRSRFGREPLHRKELLWFLRDRSALVQAVLIPLTVAALQAFNLRHLVEAAGQSWSAFCGLAVICGTYFLLVLGPRSLTSEGPALWIALTWPRGLEDLLKAKARLWWYLSSTIVAVVLVFAATRFPADVWSIALVAVGWWFFSRSLADKAVTLVAAPSSSGEPEPVPRSRHWTAMLGTLAFGSGILTRNWHLAIVGVVFSSLTAAAMWQNLRARLPFLFDPWSEKLPPPPTLLHAMVSIAAMAEGVALVTALFAAFGGPESFGIARATAYGIGSLITYLILQGFLTNRGVKASAIWNWTRTAGDQAPMPKPLFSDRVTLLGIGAFAGSLLGLLAVGYRTVLWHIPWIHQRIEQQVSFEKSSHAAIWWLALLAVGFAPFAEEYLFRGLLYRALDREWGGWRALIGSASFFAIYHPPMSWLPVGALGMLNAFLFKKTGRLAPCVLSHMAYNAVVVLTV